MIWEEAELASGRYLAPPNHFLAVVALLVHQQDRCASVQLCKVRCLVWGCLDVGVDGAGVHAEGPAVDVRALLTLHHNQLRFTRDTQ